MISGSVFVVGSINRDFILTLEARPAPGETVTDAELSLHNGGKGANQSAAAAKLGANVTILGRVGDDDLGGPLIAALGEKGVNVGLVERVAGVSSGAAFITVTPDGENAIAVAPGANRSLVPQDVDAVRDHIRASDILVLQMEVPVGVVERAAETASRGGIRVILNLAPPREIPDSLLERLDPLIVNEHEAAFLLGEKVSGIEGARSAASKLLSLGPRSVVITLGGSGAVFATGKDIRHAPAPEVEAVDTTGAGDAFVGALAARLAAGDELAEAVRYAVKAGAAAVRNAGAQGALPTPEMIEEF